MPIFFSPSSSFGGIKGDPNIHHRGNPLYRQPNMPGFIQRRSATGMSPSERYAQAVRAEERRKKRKARWARADEAAAAKRAERKEAEAKKKFERKARAMPTRGDVEDMGSPRIPSSLLSRPLSLSSAFASVEPQATSDAVAPLSGLMRQPDDPFDYWKPLGPNTARADYLAPNWPMYIDAPNPFESYGPTSLRTPLLGPTISDALR
jgi:hypothetical protein